MCCFLFFQFKCLEFMVEVCVCGCSSGFICNLHIIFGYMFSATEYHLGLLKAKLAKCRQQLLEPTGKTGAKVVLDKLIVSHNRPDMTALFGWV